jgi:ubiquinone/menaquinone biosynthesis C-methylase UbiE
LVLCLPALAGPPEHAHRPWSDVEHWAGVFDDPARDAWQQPIFLVEFLGVTRGDVVADLGAGTGYMTKPLSIKVGSEGKVYAVDIEPAMLDHLMARDDIVAERVVPVVASATDPNLPEGAVDLVLVVNTWHHISKRGKYIRRLQKSLSREGRVAIVDFREGELPVGPPPETKLSRDQVVREFTDEGWRFVAESVALPYQYVLVFFPPAQRDTRRFIGR